MSEIAARFEPEIPGKTRWRVMNAIFGTAIELLFVNSHRQADLLARRGPEISISNHRSNLDTLLLGRTLQHIRTPFLPAKKELKKPLLGWMLKGSGALFFDRKDSKERGKVFEEMGHQLDEGHQVHIFVEETRHNRTNRLGSIVDSAVSLADRHDLDRLMLIGIGGTEKWWQLRKHLEFAEVSLGGLRSVLDQRRTYLKSDLKMTAQEASARLADFYGGDALSDEQLAGVLNPPEEGLHVRRRQRSEIIRPTADVSRPQIYSIFTEQVVRPALQQVVDIAYAEAGVELAEAA